MAGGRPTKYKPEYVKIAQAMAKLGATDVDVARALGVAVSTVSLWKVQHQEFSEALTVSKETADKNVVESLYKRAMGYTVTEDEVKVVGGKIQRVQVTKHYPPDPTSMIFWLKNRDSKNWRDKRDTEISGSLNLTDMTDEELDRAIAAKEGALQAGED